MTESERARSFLDKVRKVRSSVASSEVAVSSRERLADDVDWGLAIARRAKVRRYARVAGDAIEKETLRE